MALARMTGPMSHWKPWSPVTEEGQQGPPGSQGHCAGGHLTRSHTDEAQHCPGSEGAPVGTGTVLAGHTRCSAIRNPPSSAGFWPDQYSQSELSSPFSGSTLKCHILSHSHPRDSTPPAAGGVGRGMGPQYLGEKDHLQMQDVRLKCPMTMK